MESKLIGTFLIKFWSPNIFLFIFDETRKICIYIGEILKLECIFICILWNSEDQIYSYSYLVTILKFVHNAMHCILLIVLYALYYCFVILLLYPVLYSLHIVFAALYCMLSLSEYYYMHFNLCIELYVLCFKDCI